METKHAFAAGFFIGEGCITVTRKISRNNHVRHILICCITNTELDLLIFFKENYSGSIRPRRSTNLSRKPLWEWRTEGSKAELFLECVFAYLQGKKLLKAKYALELRSLMRGNRLKRDLRGRATTLNVLEIEKRDELTNLLKSA